MPIRFYLVRHAPAEPRAHGGDDARALTRDGRDAFRRHVRALAPELRVARIATSPYRRARETAELLAAATGARAEEEDALSPGRSPARDVLALGARLGAGAALVGHNPEIAEAIALAAGGRVDVAPGAIAAIDADADRFALGWIRTPA